MYVRPTPPTASNAADQYDLFYVLFRGRLHLSWDGLAKVGASGGWISWPEWSRNDLTDYMVYGVVAHEFGHNLGLHHATQGDVEYGDPYDVMGNGRSKFAEFNAGYKRRLVYINDDEAMSVDTSVLMPATAVRLFSHDHARPTGDVTLTISANKEVKWTKEECPCVAGTTDAAAGKHCWYPAGGYCDVRTFTDVETGAKTCYPGAEMDCAKPNHM